MCRRRTVHFLHADCLEHQRGQESGPKAEALVKRDMFWARGKSKKAEVTGAPCFEAGEDGFDQLAADATVPKRRVNGEGAEETHRAQAVQALASSISFSPKAMTDQII